MTKHTHIFTQVGRELTQLLFSVFGVKQYQIPVLRTDRLSGNRKRMLDSYLHNCTKRF